MIGVARTLLGSKVTAVISGAKQMALGAVSLVLLGCDNRRIRDELPTYLFASCFLAVSSFSAIIFVGLAARLRPYRLLLFLVGFSLTASAQNWSPFLDPSRAVDWTSAGFTIPNYTANCATQPSLATGSGAASANATAIQNALNSCDATHNVVNIPAGTFYTVGILWVAGQAGVAWGGTEFHHHHFRQGKWLAGGLSEGLWMRRWCPL